MPGRRTPQWDTELGRLLYLDGRTDEQIAEELGTSKIAVMNYRIRHWGKANTRPESAPEKSAEATVVSEKKEQPAGEPQERARPQHSVSMATPDGVYSILEEATKTKAGIEAICTADAILCLWNWASADDLRRARAAINHLINRLEG